VVRSLFLFFLLTLRVASATTAAELARQIKSAAFDPEECYRVTELNFNKEDIKLYLTSGYLIFTKPIAGIRPAAVFVTTAVAGDAEVILMPPVRSERMSLAHFTESPNLDEHFKAAVFIFTDGTAENLLARIHDSALKNMPEVGNLLVDQWTPTLHNLTGSFETRLVHDLLSPARKSGLFYAAVSGNQLGNFDLLYDPTGHEQIFAGKLAYRDNRTFFDTWTSFASRSSRNAAQTEPPPYAFDNFRIDSTIDADLTLKSVTRVAFTAKQNSGSAIPLNISRGMHVTQASLDGKPIEVFERDSLRSNLIASTGNQQVLLVVESPVEPGKTHELEIHSEGEVIMKAGDGVYYVTSRGTWYPRLGMEFANYDMTFRYQKNLTLVATGNPMDDRVEGSLRITRYKTDSPTRFAGFNLGDFQSISTTQNGYKIGVYANRHLENALKPKNPPPAIVVPPPFNRSRRQDPIIADAMPVVPDPGARLDQLAKGVGDALEFMSAAFGPTPIHNLAITPIPGGFGQGFPGLVYLATMSYLTPEQRPAYFRDRPQQTFYSELLEAHEVAHQWWGNMVIPASYQDEWLMESLANYSALLLLEKKKGIKAVDAVLDDYRIHLLAKVESGHTLESAGPITWGFRLQTSLTPGAWHTVTYEKGTWIIHMLRRRLGDEKFMSLLREICTRYRFSAISTDQFRELAAKYAPPKVGDADLKGFFENWVYGTGIPTVKLSYSVRGLKLVGTVAQRDVEDDFTAFVPVEVQNRREKTVYWLPTGSDPVSFSIPMKVPPTKVALLPTDCLITAAK
jgi:Peptidase family M1 domain